MGPISQFLTRNKVAVMVALAVLFGVLLAIGWGQGASFAAMLWGGLLMYYVASAEPPPAEEEGEA